MSKRKKFNVTVLYPATAAGKTELAKKVAVLHSDAVIKKISLLNCRKCEKNKILDSVILAVKNQNT